MTLVGSIAGCLLVVVLAYLEIVRVGRDMATDATSPISEEANPGWTVLLATLTALTVIGLGPRLWDLLT